MIPLGDSLAARRYAIFGLGKAGRAAAAALQAAGAAFCAWDDSADARDAFDYPERLKSPDETPWEAVDTLVLAPGVPLTHPAPHPVVKLARAAKCEIICEAELLARACPTACYVGVTGTNGKSTTTALIGHLLSVAGRNVQTGGNLGVPALALQPLGRDGVYVLELSSYQLDLLDRFHAHIAVLLNLTPDHLDRHGDMAGYAAAKRRIFTHQGPGDTALIGVDDADSRAIYRELCAAAVSGYAVRAMTVESDRCDREADIRVTAAGMLTDCRWPELCVDLTALPRLRGRHNWQNIAASWGVCVALGLEPSVFVQGLSSFPGLPHRLEIVAETATITFVNDSKATNVEAALRALSSYPEDVFWIAGGRPKGDDLEPLLPYLSGIRAAYVIGEAAPRFQRFLEGKRPCVSCDKLEDAFVLAVAEAARYAQENGKRATLLLSPACASFDQWPNFEARGAAFRKLAIEYAALEAGGGRTERTTHVAY